MSRPNSAATRVDDKMMQANTLQENENSSRIAPKPTAVPMAKAGTGAAPAPSRRFGTSLSINTNAPASSGLAGRGLPTAAPKPSVAPTLPAAPLDHVTAADIAGAMDIDIADRYNEMAVTDYVEDIYSNLRRKEMELAPPANYMATQEDINDKMRTILVDWLIEVHLKFKLRHETLFLTVNIIDRFLTVQKVARQRLQLVGVTALMLAAKYEEIYPPEVRDYVYICDNAYTREQIVQMEQLILAKLNFRLTVPTQRSYLKRFCKAAQGDARHLMLTSYLMELTLVDSGALAFRPSELCAAATHLALRMTGMPPWSPTLAKYTRFLVADLDAPARYIEGLHRRASDPAAAQKAAHKKYSSSRFHSVSAIPMP